MIDCIFCKIRDGEIEKEFTFRDDEIMVFPDIHPVRPVHLLIVPIRHIEDFLELDDKTEKKLTETVKMIILKTGLDKKGYRLGINGGGAQIIRHLHIHLIGPMGKEDSL